MMHQQWQSSKSRRKASLKGAPPGRSNPGEFDELLSFSPYIRGPSPHMWDALEDIVPTAADADLSFPRPPLPPAAAAPDPGEFPLLQAVTQQGPAPGQFFDAELSCLQRLKRGMQQQWWCWSLHGPCVFAVCVAKKTSINLLFGANSVGSQRHTGSQQTPIYPSTIIRCGQRWSGGAFPLRAA